MFSLDELEHPLVQAPLGGGPSTTALAAAVADAGALAFLATGYKTPDAVRADVDELRSRTSAPFGVNVFAPGPGGDAAAVERYAASLAAEAGRYDAALGEPRHDDDHYEAKLALLAEQRVAVVSFTFGCPSAGVVARLHDAGSAVWVTATTVAEARAVERAGADALVVQGVEAGGHRGSFDGAAPGDLGLLALLQLIGDAVALPLVAAGGIANGRGVAAVLAAGASAAAPGTAPMLAAQAGPAPADRAAPARPAPAPPPRRV